MAAPGAEPRARILIVCEDDDIAGFSGESLRRAGHTVVVCRGREGVRSIGEAAARTGGAAGSPADLLVLDRDLPSADRSAIRAALGAWKGRDSLPLILLGSGDPSALVPDGWHEDAILAVGRPPGAREITVAAGSLLRLAYYRGYRDLLHDLSQPVTSLHALARTLARLSPTDDDTRRTIERIRAEAERLMTLMEAFQRRRAGLS